MKHKNFLQLRGRWRRWLLLCFLVNLLLTHIAFPIGNLFSAAPIGYIDFMQHYSKAEAFTKMVKEHGIMWGYNPAYMAGTPEISDYDLDNKFVEITTLGLSYFQVSTIQAFKIIIFCEWLFGPFLVLLGFRNFGFNRQKSLWACWAAMMILNGPVGLFFNLGGMFSFVFATLFSFFTVSVFYRVLVNGDRHKKTLLVLSSALAPLLHSTSVFMVGIPAAIIVLLKFKTIAKKNWLLLGATAGAVVLLNLFWLIPFFQNFKYTDFNDVAWTGQADLLTGAVQWLSAFLLTMGGLFALVYGAAGLKVLYRQARRELAILSAGVLAIIFLVRWPGWLMTRSIQPNRFALSFLLYLLIPAIAYLGMIDHEKKLVKTLHIGRAGHVSRTVCPWVLAISLVIPGGVMAAIRLGNPSAFRTSPTLMIAHILFGRTLGPGCLAEPETRELIGWLNTHTSPAQGRIMIEHPQGEGAESPFAVFYSGLITGIANYVDGQFLGAPRFEPPLLHNQLTRIDHCSMFDIPLKELSREKLLKRLELYNVKWIVAVQGTMTAYLEQFPELFRPVKTIANVTIYEVRQQGGYFLKGSGQIRVSLNQIHLEHLEGDDVIIKYHWAKDFQASPPVVLEPFYPQEDGVGFIRLRHPPRQVTLCFRGAGLEKCAAEGDKKP